jgi:hypothetical protein
MKAIVPWSKDDRIHRYAAFVRAAYRETQAANLEYLMDYYPDGTQFVVLPMDMAYMGAGKVKEDIDDQHFELAKLSMDNRYKPILLPFAHIDPRRPQAGRRLKMLVEKAHFRGVKIYPTLGYAPDDRVLMNEIYPYMVESEKYSEKRLSIDLRYALGEEMFWKIANENPKTYLGT